jgi:hypothetical protein
MLTETDLGSASAGSEPPEEHWQVLKRWRPRGAVVAHRPVIAPHRYYRAGVRVYR